MVHDDGDEEDLEEEEVQDWIVRIRVRVRVRPKRLICYHLL